MSFQISKSDSNGIRLVNLHDDQQSVTVSIAPEYGVMLHAMEIPLNGEPYNIVLNYESKDEIEKNLATSYRSSKLSPFPCRIKNGQYTWGGQLFEFSNKFADGTAIHGLLFNKPFRIKEEVSTAFMASAVFEYVYTSNDPGYPFDYTCIISYTLLPSKTLQLQTTLINNGSTAIPVADGWHPYFRLKGKVNNLHLQFPSAGMVEFGNDLIPTGHIIPFNDFNRSSLIEDINLDNCFLLEETAGQPVCILSNPEENLRLQFITDGQYPFLQLYIPDDRNSIAIENLSSAPDVFNNKMGLILLEPGMPKTFTLHYQVNTIEST
jgi:aldose 1-epimerase